MRTSSICVNDTSTFALDRSTRETRARRPRLEFGRYLGLAVLGVGLAVAVHAALSAGADTTRFSVLAALAAGLGLIQAWLGVDSGRLGQGLVGVVAGGAAIALAAASLPADAALLSGAYLLAGAAAVLRHSRLTGQWVPTAALSLTLAVLSLA